MNLWRYLCKLWTGEPGDNMLDHVPVQQRDEQAADRLRRAIKRASKRHGKAFRTGPESVAREVMRSPGKFVVAQSGQKSQEPDATEAESKVRKIVRKP